MTCENNEFNTVYKVVVNHKGQYSIWLDYQKNPLGWKDVGKTGSKSECLAYIKKIWTDITHIDLHRKTDEAVSED